jgi:hypothetical protein
MLKNKKRWNWTFKQKGKDRIRSCAKNLGFSGMPLCNQQLHTDILDAMCKDFFDENYSHPTRTGRGTAKWDWW